MKSNVTRPSERWNMRPHRGVRENEDYRNSGTGHEINLETEDVLDLKKMLSTGNESGLQFSLCTKRNLPTSWSYGT